MKHDHEKWSIVAHAVLAFSLIWTTGLRPASATGAISYLTNSFDRDILACGPNSLFMFLILSGYSNVTFSQFEDIPVFPNGASLLSLRDASAKYGVRTEIRRYRHEDIVSLPVPAIVQLTNHAGHSPYHFNVIYKVTSGRCHMLDGITGERFWCHRENLRNWWTGYALVGGQPPSAIGSNVRLMVFVSACLLTINLVFFVNFIRSLKRQVKGAKTMNQLGAAP